MADTLISTQRVQLIFFAAYIKKFKKFAYPSSILTGDNYHAIELEYTVHSWSNITVKIELN